MKKISIILIVNLIIGNTVAWFLGAAPIEFSVIEYSGPEIDRIQELTTEIESSIDVDTLIELGSILSNHNELEKANYYLSQAIALEADNPLAIAVFNSNESKRSGAMLDLSMGLYKLYWLWKSCSKLNEAVSLSPENFEIRMYRLATFAGVGKVNRYYDEVFNDETWFLNFISKYKSSIPIEVEQQFYLSMAAAYLAENDKRSINKAKSYLKMFERNELVSNLQKVELQKIKLKLLEVNGVSHKA